MRQELARESGDSPGHYYRSSKWRLREIGRLAAANSSWSLAGH
jgi:hypothetical protein